MRLELPMTGSWLNLEALNPMPMTGSRSNLEALNPMPMTVSWLNLTRHKAGDAVSSSRTLKALPVDTFYTCLITIAALYWFNVKARRRPWAARGVCGHWAWTSFCMRHARMVVPVTWSWLH